MKLIINIPNRIYNMVQNKTLNIIDSEIVEKSIRNGTPIPDNATNGEVLDLMFPHEETIAPDWFNAPYQKGGKE